MDCTFAFDISPLDLSRDDDLLLDWQFGVPNISNMFDDDIFNLDPVDIQSVPIVIPCPVIPLHHDQQVPLLFQDEVLYDIDGDLFGVWDGESNIQQEITTQPLILRNTRTSGVMEMEKAKSGREREDIGHKLTRGVVSQYFYMPITEAAKELKVGLTLLKKCCRQLGIRRWPHRKLMSLKTLMKNVEEGSESEEKKREWIWRLEEERRLIEEMPDLQMHHNIKRLRQSCFKENYKKRRRITNMDNFDPHLLELEDEEVLR